MWLVRNPCTKMGYILLLKEPCRETAVCSDVATLNINDFDINDFGYNDRDTIMTTNN